MTYDEWIKLGFKRVDIEDLVEEQRTGYGGYILEKQIDKYMKIYVYWDKLGVPFLQSDLHDNPDKVVRQYVNVDFAINLAKLYNV